MGSVKMVKKKDSKYILEADLTIISKGLDMSGE